MRIGHESSVHVSMSAACFAKMNARKNELLDHRLDKLETHARVVGRAAILFKELYVAVLYKPGGRGMREAQASFDHTLANSMANSMPYEDI